ncbi:MAG: hypothetical protein JW923_02215 [Spirochaetales bacterium]|nr:hypothetical protein [Spirochaetales bacterium]
MKADPASGAPRGVFRLWMAVAASVALVLVVALWSPWLPRVALIGLTDAEVLAVRLGLPDTARISLVADDSERDTLPGGLLVYRAALAYRDRTFSELPLDLAMLTVPSLRAAGAVNGTQRALPVLVDHVELAWSKQRMGMAGLSQPTSLEDLERALERWSSLKDASGDARERSAWPLVFCGGDDESLLQALSVMLVAETGYQGYESARQALASGTGMADVLGGSGGQSPGSVALLAAAGRLKSWIRLGLVHPEWHALKAADLRALLHGGSVFMAIQSLSFRRSVDYAAINEYGSSRFPAASGAPKDAIVAPLTLASIVGSRASALDALRGLYDPALGKEMAALSGRSSALAAAAAPDIQAADALAAVAASRYVVNGLYRDAFADAASAKAAARELRDWLRG